MNGHHSSVRGLNRGALLLDILVSVLFAVVCIASPPLNQPNSRQTKRLQNELLDRKEEEMAYPRSIAQGNAPLQCSLSPAGCFPVYFIIGSPKSGTSSLWGFISEYGNNYRRIQGHGTSSNALSSLHNISNSPPCAPPRLKEPRFWVAVKHPEESLGHLLVKKYLPKYMYHPAFCPSSSFVDATPTYLGDVKVPLRMRTLIPNALHSMLRFTASLRHPIARDLSWFNVLNQKPFNGGGGVSKEMFVENIDAWSHNEAFFTVNEAGIRTIRMNDLKKLCSGKNASLCYSFYSQFAINSYDICRRKAEVHLDDFEAFKKNVTEEVMQTQGLNSFLLEDTYWMEAYIYSRCYQASILRTGLYGPQLLNWLRYWSFRQIMIIHYDDLFNGGTNDSELRYRHQILSRFLLHFGYEHHSTSKLDLKYDLLQVPHANEGPSTENKVHLRDVSCSTLCRMQSFFNVSSTMSLHLLQRYYYINTTQFWKQTSHDVNRSCQC